MSKPPAHAPRTASLSLDGALSSARNALDAGRLQEAENSLDAALPQTDRLGEAFELKALVAYRQGNHQKAVRWFETAVTLLPETGARQSNFAAVLRAAGRRRAAERQYRRALSLAPENPVTHNNLANLLRDEGRHEDAVEHYERALAIRPDYVQALANLAICRRARGDSEAARGHLARAVELAPQTAILRERLGHVLRDLGDTEGAITCYRDALSLDPSRVANHRYLLNMKTGSPDDLDVQACLAIRAAFDRYPTRDQVQLAFAFYKALADQGEDDAAFAWLETGNRLKRSQLSYAPDPITRHFRRIAELAGTPPVPTERRAEPTTVADAPRPIFIVGVPRSGTTLVEQILAAHPQVSAGGELRLLSDTAYRVEAETGLKGTYPEYLPELAAQRAQAVGHAYLGRLRARFPGARVVTDKMPANFQYIPLINACLPHAVILHCYRDPLDTCFSCFEKLFAEAQNWSYDLTELGQFYADYSELINALREQGHPFTDVRYEDLVSDFDRQLERILRACGLDWDERCRSFWTANRSVQTASSSQVRRPLYRTSRGRARRFERHLQPLIARLPSS